MASSEILFMVYKVCSKMEEVKEGLMDKIVAKFFFLIVFQR